MIRTFLCWVLRLALRLFYRRIEVDGVERVPRDGAVIFVLNHPNALIDPLFLLCLAPRQVSFLAKAPLFRTPLVGLFVRALDSLPVYRAQEGDTRRNVETFAQARALLRTGRAIAIFPEGATHSDPRLRPLKTGAARLALGAAGADLGMPLYIVPAGLYYTDKHLFRSEALLHFGRPLPISYHSTEPDLSAAVRVVAPPDRHAVRALSERIRQELLELTVNAEDAESLRWIERGQRLFSDGGTLSEELQMRRRFAQGYAWYRKSAPRQLAALEARIDRYEARARAAGLPERTLDSERVWTLALFPLALLGALLNWPVYRLIGVAANRCDSTTKSTVKMGLSLLFFPLLWTAAALTALHYFGDLAGVVTAVMAPVSGVCAVLFQEGWTTLRARRSARRAEALRAEREEIRDDIAGVERQMLDALREA